MNGNKVNTSLFQSFVQKALQDEKDEIPLHQLRQSKTCKRVIKMHLRNNIIKKRVIIPSNLITLPFGYKESMLNFQS